MTQQLPPGDDGSRLVDDHEFEPWPGDPFAGMPRKHGQLDYECNYCGRTARHPYTPDVPLSWWWLYDPTSDTVALVCRPQCAAAYSGLAIAKITKETLQQIFKAGWKYRGPEKRDQNEVKVPKLSGGWGSGSV